MRFFTDGFKLLKQAEKPIYKAPKSVQKQLEIRRIAKDGTFEVAKNRYSRCYRFKDINYVTVSEEEQYVILKMYCKLTNSIDVSYKISVFNKNKNMQFVREHVLLEYMEDGYDNLRKIYNDIVEERLHKGRQGIDQERYLTVTVERKNYEQAKAFFATFEAGIQQLFREIGSELETLDAEERLRVLFNFYRIGEEEKYEFHFDEYVARRRDYKNDICSNYLKFSPNEFQTDKKYCRALFIKRYPTSLTDSFINEITGIPVHSITTIDVVPVPKDITTKVLQKKYLGIENDILKQQRIRNKNNDFSSDISYQKKVEKKTMEDLMDDVRENDQNLFFVGVTMIIMADTKEELNSITETIKTLGNKNMVQIEVHHLQQREALNTALPIGVRQVETMRTMLTRDIAALNPFHVQELCDEDGLVYGINGVSKNLCIANRKKLANGNAMVFGVPGSGKSFQCKMEMLGVYLGTKDDIIVIDPTLEYFDIADRLGTSVNLSSYTHNYINPLSIDLELLDVLDSNGLVRDKAEFMLGLCEQAMQEGLNSRHKSIVDRCIRHLYLNLIKSECTDMPTMTDFYHLLMAQPEVEAKDIALGLELFVYGSLNIFNNQTNVDVENNRFVVYGIRDLGKELSGISTLVMLENISARIAANARIGRATWLYIDEIHMVLEKEYSAKYLYTLWKKVRKQGGLMTGITQNILDMLQNYMASTLLANSEFIMLLKQSNLDSGKLEEVTGIPEAMLQYVSNVSSGKGIIKSGSTIIPFDNRISSRGTDSEHRNEIYDLFNTNIHEKAKLREDIEVELQ